MPSDITSFDQTFKLGAAALKVRDAGGCVEIATEWGNGSSSLTLSYGDALVLAQGVERFVSNIVRESASQARDIPPEPKPGPEPKTLLKARPVKAAGRK